jgi:hypothetical protein
MQLSEWSVGSCDMWHCPWVCGVCCVLCGWCREGCWVWLWMVLWCPPRSFVRDQRFGVTICQSQSPGLTATCTSLFCHSLYYRRIGNTGQCSTLLAVLLLTFVVHQEIRSAVLLGGVGYIGFLWWALLLGFPTRLAVSVSTQDASCLGALIAIISQHNAV